MYCPNCGTQNNDNQRFCRNCGVSLNNTLQTPNIYDKREGDSINNNFTDTQRPPKTWLTEAILATIFCCVPLGIIGIVNAAKVESTFRDGNITQSKEYSQKAAKFVKLGFWIGLGAGIIYIILIIIFALSDASSSSDFINY